MSQETIDLLHQKLAALNAQSIVIEDESHRHAGHAGAREGGHYKLSIVAAAFAGKNTLARHRVIYDVVGNLGALKIHALAIYAKAPGEV